MVTVTCDLWLCAPYSEILFEHGQRLVTGTTTFVEFLYTPSLISPMNVTS